jgi:hypothetical protein
MVFTFGIGVIVDVGNAGISVGVYKTGVRVGGTDVVIRADGVATENGLDPQPFKAIARIAAKTKVALLFFMAKPSFGIVQLNALEQNSEVV